jgi:hypothetical protein
VAEADAADVAGVATIRRSQTPSRTL